MKSIKAISILLTLAACAEPAPTLPGGASPEAALMEVAPGVLTPSETRTFQITYAGKATEIPAGARTVRLWFPVPQNSNVQTIRDLKFSRLPRFGTEPKYGNRIAYWELQGPDVGQEITMSFSCTRREIRVDRAALAADGTEAGPLPAVYLDPDRLVTIDAEIRARAARLTEGRAGTLARARAIYDDVVATMTYDKNHPGWGTGSTEHACKVGMGNCTDFHALFNSLCRASGIASGFEIGLYLPYERRSDEKLGGYHCWALFRVPGRSWVPVDCSEAARLPDRKDYFFGGHTANRVTLSTGRDLTLVPAQAGPPLNYFLNPYAEADGKPVPTEKRWSYEDLD